MSSDFVPAGSEGKPSGNDEDWLKAQQAIEATRRQKQEDARQGGGKSLYEVLQQNKTAKQEAFEESIRLKNQFRTLDDEEADFLHDVLESTRNKELQVKKETAEQLEAFRKQCEAAEKALAQGDALANNTTTDATAPTVEESWATSSRKRRRRKEKNDEAPSAKLPKKTSTFTDVPLVKLSADVSTAESLPNRESPQTTSKGSNGNSTGTANSKPKSIEHPRKSVPSMQINPLQLGLAAYSSDED